MSDTKRKTAGNPVTKPKAKGGRPPLAGKAMSAAERSRRSRAAKAKARPIKSADEVYAALVEQRGLTSAFDLALARQVVDAMVHGDLTEAVRATALLPPVVRAEVRVDRATGESDAGKRVLQMIMSSIKADEVELRERARRGEQLSEVEQLRLRLREAEEAAEAASELDEAEQVQPEAKVAESTALQAAQARIASLEDEVKHLRGTKPRRLPPPSAVSEAVPPPAPAAPAPQRQLDWDSTENAARWREWRANGGYDNWWTSGPFGRREW